MSIVKISKKIEYALMSLKHISDKSTQKKEDLTSAREVCDQYKIPFDTTAKVMQSLNSVGVLHSVKGIKGGYSLGQDLNEISLLSLCEIIEGKQASGFCQTTNGDVCELFECCNIKTPLDRLNKNLLQFFGQITINQLLEDNFKGLA